MGRLKKRSAAALVLALSAALSVFVGGGWKLRKERAAAEDVFFNGSAGFSVYNDLLELRESGYNLLRVSESLRGAEEEQRAAASAWARLDEAKTPEQYADAFRELSETVGALDQALTAGGAVLPDSWGRQLRSFDEYASHLRFDTHYDAKAEAYNRILEDPLAGLIGRATGCTEMPRFTGER